MEVGGFSVDERELPALKGFSTNCTCIVFHRLSFNNFCFTTGHYLETYIYFSLNS